MRVGFNARYLYDPALRGLNRYAFRLLRDLEKISDVQLYLVSEERYPVHESYRLALRAQVTNLPASRTIFWEQWQLPLYLKDLKPDVFHAPADGGLPFRKVCPYVLTLHGVPAWSLASLVKSGDLPGKLEDYLDTPTNVRGVVTGALSNLRARLFTQFYLRAADHVITVSEFSKLELVRFLGISPDNVQVIYESADECFSQPLSEEYIQQIRVKHRIPPRFVLFVGGFDKRKNVSTLLRAFADLKRVEDDVALVLVGIGGDIKGCRGHSAALNLREGQNVFFLERIADMELAALYRAAALFTTLSWHEGFCLPIVEAMTSGTPVLASSFGAIPEVLGDGGWVVDPRHVEEVVDSMQAILCQREVREELHARALRRSAAFSGRGAAEATLAVYKKLASK